jgi:hypothetical protein
VRVAFQQIFDSQQRDGLVETNRASPRRRAPQRVVEVPAGLEVRKQTVFLEYITDRPLVRRQKSRGVLPGFALDP